MEKWYIVTDSDWQWADIQDGAPWIGLARTPEEAVQKAVAFWWEAAEGGRPFDGAHLVVGVITAVGFMSVEIVDGDKARYDPFQPLHEDGNDKDGATAIDAAAAPAPDEDTGPQHSGEPRGLARDHPQGYAEEPGS